MKVVRPTVFPKPGTYSTNKVHVNLMSFTKDAQIHYTLDGSEPNETSAVFNLADGLLTFKLNGPDLDGKVETVKKDFLIKAKAVKEGYEDSDVAEFKFSLSSLPEGEYYYTILQEKETDSPAVIRIEDQMQVKMYFVVGSARALLIDCGNDKVSDLKGLLDTMAGGLLYDAVITHAHPDHNAQAQALIDQGITVYYNSEDLPTYDKFGGELNGYTDLKDGHVFDLGNCQLKTYKVPAHTVGHVVLLDEKNGFLFSADAFGNNRNTSLDTALLHLGGGEDSTMDQFLSVLQNFRNAAEGKIKKIFFGHNDNVLNESYLENLEQAVQQAVDFGEEALVPTLRPAAECMGSSKISLVGNYISDLDWVGINLIDVYSGSYTSENIASLSAILINNGVLEPKFHPNFENYTLQINPDIQEIEISAISTSTRVKKLEINQIAVSIREYLKIKVENNSEILIHVVAPNSVDDKDYKLIVKQNESY